MILLRYNVDKPQNSYGHVRIFTRKKEDEKLQQIVYRSCKLEEFIYLLDVMNSVYVKAIANQPTCLVLEKVIATGYSLSIFSYSSQDELEHWS